MILIMGAIKTHSFNLPFRLITGRSINHAVVANRGFSRNMQISYFRRAKM